MRARENILDAVSRAGVVTIKTIANSPLWLCAVVTPVSFVAALVALGFGDRDFAWAFFGVGVFAALYAVAYMTYFAVRDPHRLQSETYQLEHKRLTLQSKEHPKPRPAEDEELTEDPASSPLPPGEGR